MADFAKYDQLRLVVFHGNRVTDTDNVIMSIVVQQTGRKKDMCTAALAELKTESQKVFGPTAELIFRKFLPNKAGLTDPLDPTSFTSYGHVIRFLNAIGNVPVHVEKYDELRCTDLRGECATATDSPLDQVPDVWPDFCIIKGGDEVYKEQTPPLHDALVAFGNVVRASGDTTTALKSLKALHKPSTYYKTMYGDLVQNQARAGNKLLVVVVDGREDKASRNGTVRVFVDKSKKCSVKIEHTPGSPMEVIPIATEEVNRIKTHPKPPDATWGAVFKVGPNLYCAATDALYAALNDPDPGNSPYDVPIVSGYIGTANDRYLFEKDIFDKCVSKYGMKQPPDHFQIVFAPVPDYTIMGAAQHGLITDALDRMAMAPNDMVCVHCAQGYGRSGQVLYTLFAHYAPEALQTAKHAAAFVNAVHFEGADEITRTIGPTFNMPSDWMFRAARRGGSDNPRPVFFSAFADLGSQSR